MAMYASSSSSWDTIWMGRKCLLTIRYMFL
jgi:hypothetical protein